MGSFDLRVSVDAAEPLRLLRNAEKRIDYAIVNALRGAALAVQKAERAHVAAAFTVRKPAFILRQVAVINPWPSVAGKRFYVRISVGQKERLMLSEYERGASRSGQKALHEAGQPGVGVPVLGSAARPAQGAIIPMALWISHLGLERAGGGLIGEVGSKGMRQHRARAAVVRGRQRTYLIPNVGIFQRTGPGTTVMLYGFKPEVALPPRLEFHPIAVRVALSTFPMLLRGEVADAFLFQAKRGAERLLGALPVEAA